MQTLQLNIEKRNQTIEIWPKDTNRHFSQKDLEMANKHTKRCSRALFMDM